MSKKDKRIIRQIGGAAALLLAAGVVLNALFTYCAVTASCRQLAGEPGDLSGVMNTALRLALIQGLISLAGLALIAALTQAKLRQAVLGPLETLTRCLRRYRASLDRKAVAELENHPFDNEFNAPAAELAALPAELEAKIAKVSRLSAEKERARTERSMAAHIREALLPDAFPAFPDRKEFELYAAMDPVKEMGGDFYDFFLLDDDRLALAVGDVSDNGMPTALFLMAVRTMLKDALLSGLSPAAALTRVNGLLFENNESELFAGVWLGVLTVSTGELVWADAGHSRTLLYQNGSWRFLPKGKAPALAFADPKELEKMPEIHRFRDTVLRLRPGDEVFQYTNGVTEASCDVSAGKNAAEFLFGEDRLLEAVDELGGAKPELLLPHVRRRVDEFTDHAPQLDDVTMLALRYKGPGERKKSEPAKEQPGNEEPRRDRRKPYRKKRGDGTKSERGGRDA